MLQINNLSITFGCKTIVEDISITIQEGEIVGIIGNNGSGKTSIISSIMSMIPYSKGQILFYSKKLDKANNYKNKIGYIPENVELFDCITGNDYIKFVSKLRKNSNETYAKAMELAEYFKITSLLNAKIETYSKGNKQKLAIITSMMHNPKLLVLDEPLDGLDSLSVQKYKSLLNTFKNGGGFVLLCCHNVEFVVDLCDRIHYIESGKITKTIDVNKLCRQEKEELCNEFLEAI